jgi:hypothetical protein
VSPSVGNRFPIVNLHEICLRISAVILLETGSLPLFVSDGKIHYVVGGFHFIVDNNISSAGTTLLPTITHLPLHCPRVNKIITFMHVCGVDLLIILYPFLIFVVGAHRRDKKRMQDSGGRE